MEIFLAKSVVFMVFVSWIWITGKMMLLGIAIDTRFAFHPTRHEEYAPNVYRATEVMIVSAFLLHLLVRRQIGGGLGLLLVFHIAAAFTFVFAIYLMQRFSGITHNALHKKLAVRLLAPSFISTAITGPILIWRL